MLNSVPHRRYLESVYPDLHVLAMGRLEGEAMSASHNLQEVQERHSNEARPQRNNLKMRGIINRISTMKIEELRPAGLLIAHEKVREQGKTCLKAIIKILGAAFGDDCFTNIHFHADSGL
jgi:hypothetical protein